MKRLFILIGLAFIAMPATACRTSWQACWFGQEEANNQCVGQIKLMSAYETKLWLQNNPNWRLPSRQELHELFHDSQSQALRQQAIAAGHDAVLSADVMRHGNELLAVSVNISNGSVELRAWQHPMLVILRQTSW